MNIEDLKTEQERPKKLPDETKTRESAHLTDEEKVAVNEYRERLKAQEDALKEVERLVDIEIVRTKIEKGKDIK